MYGCISMCHVTQGTGLTLPGHASLQFDEEGGDLDDMRAAAWAYMHLADSQYLPLERLRLLPFLVKVKQGQAIALVGLTRSTTQLVY
jgi:hypothetical protein